MEAERTTGPGAGPVFWILFSMVAVGLGLMIAVPLTGR